MKYLALIYSTEGSGPEYGTPEFGAYMGAYQKLNGTFTDEGVMMGGEALEPVNTATSVRVRGGKIETMDGPFAETKEQLGGFYMLDCPDLDAAIRYAAMIPTAAHGTVEIRPIMEINFE